MFHLFGAIDEFQRELIVEGAHEGLTAARARGRVGGRPAAMTELQVGQARQTYTANAPTPFSRSPRPFGVARATVYRHLNPGNPRQGETA
ncbi:hypothetical protein ACIBI3_19950 [Actinomadura luteofluorescens]|uniref:hypothetical protein n=1 Tax=Actinomadura luteofluorescens TaxID=46163 RepID=UPI0037B381C1